MILEGVGADLAVRASFLGAVFVAFVYYFGWNVTRHETDISTKFDVIDAGLFIVAFLIIFPGIAAFALYSFVNSNIPDLSAPLGISTYLGILAFFLYYRRKFDRTDLNEMDLDSRRLLGYIFSAFVAHLAIFSTFEIHWIFTSLTLILAFAYLTFLTSGMGKLEQTPKTIRVEYEGGEISGRLFRFNDQFLYIQTEEGVSVVNKDSVKAFHDEVEVEGLE